jgi:hypothetical protein
MGELSRRYPDERIRIFSSTPLVQGDSAMPENV